MTAAPKASTPRPAAWRPLWPTVCGLARLGTMVARGGFRLGGPYWTWRRHTAFGPWGPADAADNRRAVLEYARWVHEFRRFR